MAYKELGVTIIQQFTAANAPIAVPLLPLLLIGPGYNVQSRASHSTPEAYDGQAKSISYPNLDTGEWVDLGDETSWGENENAYPVRVFLVDGRKSIDSYTSGYFASDNHYAGTKQAASTIITGLAAGSFNQGHVGKAVYVHTGDASDTGLRTITAVSVAGDEITLDGANWNTAEAANVSLIPSNGLVNRFFSAGNFTQARVGDQLEIAPAYTTTYTIAAVDPSGNYVDITTLASPTADTLGWRVTAEFPEVAVTSTLNENQVELASDDFDYDKDQINLDAGILDPTSPSGPIISGSIKVSYRALKTSLADSTGSLNFEDDINDIGVQTEANPLALAAKKALENTTFTIYYTGFDVTENVKNGITQFDGPTKMSVSDQLDRVADEDMYVLVMLSQNTSHTQLLDTHVTDVSSPTGIYNRVRIGIANTALITETTLQLSSSWATWDVEGLTEVQASTDGQLWDKSGRLYSRGTKDFPDFDGTTSPLPLNPDTDLVRLSGGTITNNDGFWELERTEQLPIRQGGTDAENALRRGYVAAYGNRIRSCTFKLTASDNGSLVRLTGPTGTFRYLDGLSLPSAARIYLPGEMDGVIGTITALDTTNYTWVDTDVPWLASYATSEASQISVTARDAIFAPPGLTTQREVITDATASTTSATDIVTAAAGFFTGLVGQTLQLSGTTAGADDGYHQIIAVNGSGSEATVASNLTTDDAGSVTVTVDLLRLNGTAGLGEFSGVVAADTGTLRYAGRDFAIAGAKVSGTSNLDSFPAGTWGPDDVGRTIRFYESAAAFEEATITAFVSDTEITTDAAAFASNNAITAQIMDIDYSAAASFTVYSVDASDNYIVTTLNWAQQYAGNNIASAIVTGKGTFGQGDIQRTVRILTGVYAGQTYTIHAVRGEELILENQTAFGSTAGLGDNSTGEDLAGFSIAFVTTPGNNTVRLSTRDGAYPEDEAGKTYSFQRDFRRLTVTGETFVTKGLQADDIIRITSPTELAGDYEVDAVLNEESVNFKAGNAFDLTALTEAINGGALDSLDYELIRPKDKDAQAETIRDFASAFANRRLVMVWPDISLMDVDGTIVQVPGYFWSAIIGSLISGLPPQQPLSRLGMVGMEQVLHGKVDNYFTRVQLNTIASGGVMIVHQESDTDTPHIRHQLSTDMSDIKFQEVSVTKIIDYISRIIKQEFDLYLGKYNITNQLLSKLRQVGQTIVTFCENQLDPKAGPLVNEIEFISIEPSSTAVDEVEAEVDLDVPIPFNRLTVTVRA